VVALSQGTPWLLVVRAGLPAKRGDLGAIKGLRVTAAEGPDLALRQMLIAARIDPDRDIEMIELPGAKARDVSFGVFAARALEEGLIDAFWANAMGAELATSRGAGRILVDVRRGDDPAGVRHFTFAGLATTDAFIQREPHSVEAAVRAIVKTQKALRADPSLARAVGERKFPPDAARLIAPIVERDVVFYDPVISTEAVKGLNAFARSTGHLSDAVPYEQVVDVRFCGLWDSA
jgi:NitT/TauT family transport system substrate-binding protein